jgi:hypothetical protein
MSSFILNKVISVGWVSDGFESSSVDNGELSSSDDVVIDIPIVAKQNIAPAGITVIEKEAESPKGCCFWGTVKDWVWPDTSKKQPESCFQKAWSCFFPTDYERRFIPAEVESVLSAVLAAVELSNSWKLAIGLFSMPFIARNGRLDYQFYKHNTWKDGSKLPYLVSLGGQFVQGVGMVATIAAAIKGLSDQDSDNSFLESSSHILLGVGLDLVGLGCAISGSLMTRKMWKNPEERTVEHKLDLGYNSLFVSGTPVISVELIKPGTFSVFAKCLSLTGIALGSFLPNIFTPLCVKEKGSKDDDGVEAMELGTAGLDISPSYTSTVLPSMV